jgi:EAL domain-containing protein (putative c-di-GMP-specific phosphodiesterase class I)
MLALAGALGMHATAEGVEREDQAAVLRELGCSGAQGYLYSKAVPPESVSAMLEAAFF